MSVNPFGDEADSVFAWKQRFQQSEKEKTFLSQRVTELKTELNSLKDTYSTRTTELEISESELSTIKTELLSIKNISRERRQRVIELERKIETSGINHLRTENERLITELDELRSAKARGDFDEISTNLASSITPIMLREYDPINPRYEDAFIDLVEAVIREGDTIEKIIGMLIKYGGSAPKHKLRAVVNASEFTIALEVLSEENVLRVVDDTIFLINSEETEAMSGDNFSKLEMTELFDRLEEIIADSTVKKIVKSLNQFRDVLQDGDIPVTTMLFQIRKLSENIQKNTVTRKEALEQLHEWRAKMLT